MLTLKKIKIKQPNLRFKITSTTETLYKLNFIPLLNDIKLEPNKIASRQVSLIGRINIFKMVILPKIMYKMQMLPISLPQVYFKKLQTLLLRFIWQKKKPCISLTVLTREKGQGGLGVPDLKNYYNAILLSRVIEWAKNNKEKRWVKMESTMNKVTLARIIWIPAHLRELSENTHSITQKALAFWDFIHKREKWGYNSPLIPLKITKY